MKEKQLLCRNLAVIKTRVEMMGSDFSNENQIHIGVAQQIAQKAINEMLQNINSKKTCEDIKKEIESFYP